MFDEIVKITVDGVLTKVQENKVDILVCVTGFDVQFLPHFRITGLDGKAMQDQTQPNICGLNRYAGIS